MIDVLVLSDDHAFRQELLRHFEAVSLRVRTVADVAQAEQALNSRMPDVALVDLDLAATDVLGLVGRLHARSAVGIIGLTGSHDLDRRVLALAAGADSIQEKAIPVREVEAVVRSLIRRLRRPRPGEVDGEWLPPQPKGGWVFDCNGWALSAPNGRQVRLTAAEMKFVAALTRKPGLSVARDEIHIALGKPANGVEDRSVDAMLTRLRRKVEAETGDELPIKAARSVGYVFYSPVVVR